MLIFTDENTEPCPGRRVPEFKPISSGSKFNILSALPQLRLKSHERLPAFDSTERIKGISTGVGERGGGEGKEEKVRKTKTKIAQRAKTRYFPV